MRGQFVLGKTCECSFLSVATCCIGDQPRRCELGEGWNPSPLQGCSAPGAWILEQEAGAWKPCASRDVATASPLRNCDKARAPRRSALSRRISPLSRHCAILGARRGAFPRFPSFRSFVFVLKLPAWLAGRALRKRGSAGSFVYQMSTSFVRS